MTLTPLISLLLLTACGGDSGSPIQEKPLPTNPSTQPTSYTGPAAQTDDIQNFKLNVFDNLSPESRCGSCHGEGGQTPMFVRMDDVNLAYAAATPLIDLAMPANSLMVTKVAGGHNCWLESDQACADIMVTWISAWSGQAGQVNTIQLEPPTIKDPGESKNFPADPQLFADNVYPLLTAYCANCHSNEANIPISPYFASDDVDLAYAAAQSKMDIETPSNSRFVLRLRNEFHNCFSNCSDDADAMQAAIQAMSDAIPTTAVAPELVISKALSLTDGILASNGGRHESNMIAKWEFKTGSGNTAFDTSGIDPAINLTLSGNVTWIGGWGIQLIDGRAQGSTTSSRKLYDLITATGEYSIEAWVAPANVTQEGPARIVTYSGGVDATNFTLGQTLYNYDSLLRTENTGADGMPAHSTADADEDLQATLQHVVATYDPINGRRIYVNGEFTGDVDATEGASFASWDNSFAFVVGNETSGNRPWAGAVRMVAIHNRVLEPQQIFENFEVGVGQRFYLLFSVGDLINMPNSYFVFEVSQFDSYSYLFSEPFFISLDSSATPNNIPVQGMRIGINGRHATVGQAYKHLNTTLNATDYDATEGQQVSRLGTIIGLEKGPVSDEFFLSFELLGSHSNVIVEASPPPLPTPDDLPEQSDIGIRTFEEIYVTMAAATGISKNTAAVQTTYETIKQQLPTVESIDGFLASHQMAVTQLAIKYCDELVENTSLRSSYFPGFNFSAAPATAFAGSGSDLVINPLLSNVVGSNLSSQPVDADVATELNALISRLSNCTGACPADRTETIVKATCAATLGSAAMLLQ